MMKCILIGLLCVQFDLENLAIPETWIFLCRIQSFLRHHHPNSIILGQQNQCNSNLKLSHCHEKMFRSLNFILHSIWFEGWWCHDGKFFNMLVLKFIIFCSNVFVFCIVVQILVIRIHSYLKNREAKRKVALHSNTKYTVQSIFRPKIHQVIFIW